MKTSEYKGKISHLLEKQTGSREKRLRVLGSFSNGSYLEDEDGNLMMLCDLRYGEIPFAIGVKDYRLILYPDRIDQEADIRLSKNLLEVLHPSQRILIHLESSEEQRNCYQPTDFADHRQLIENQLKRCGKGVFVSLLYEDYPETVYARKIKEVLKGKQIRDRLNEDPSKLLNELIGSGPGLTPSGDDFLCGYLYYQIHVAERKKLKPLLKEIESIMYQRTNRISCLYLDHVMKGYRFSLFENVCFTASAEQLQEAILRLFEMGSNSGADILCGITYAAREYEV